MLQETFHTFPRPAISFDMTSTEAIHDVEAFLNE